jgi:ubiquinone biosynthesis protein Coq4
MDFLSMVAVQMGTHSQLIKVTNFDLAGMQEVSLVPFYAYNFGIYRTFIQLVGQARLTGFEYQMWGLQPLSISESRATRCCW